MTDNNLLFYMWAFLNAKLLKKRTPLFIGWDITNRCNSDCKYCGITAQWPEELDTQKAMLLIDGLYSLGMKRINFGGGEPLLREDLGEIIDKCKRYNIFVTVITNGALFEKRSLWLKKADFVKISLDGPEDIHDDIRQRKGSYCEVIHAIEISKKLGIDIALNTTLSRYNLDCVDFILSLASDFDIPVKFQPVNNLLSGSKNIEDAICPQGQYVKIIEKLIQYKKTDYKNRIINSIAGLRYLKNYPAVSELACCAGLLLFRIDPAGNMYRCSGAADKPYPIGSDASPLVSRLKDVMSCMPVKGCKRCLCTASLELQLAYSGRPAAIKELLNNFWN